MIDILLIEDDPDDSELALRVLEKCGIPRSRIMAIEDGARAVDFLSRSGEYGGQPESEYPRVILLDLRLPGMDGIQILQWIKADPRTRLIPVWVVTSSIRDQDAVAIHKLGIMGHLPKPLDPKKVSEVLPILEVRIPQDPS
jgi:two-component system response regulator